MRSIFGNAFLRVAAEPKVRGRYLKKGGKESKCVK